LKKGLFETAHEGTLFLDEIGDIGPAVQVKLLRVMQEQEFRRVGGTVPLKVDVRIIAATNRDLDALVREGRFRDDLFYRLNVLRLVVPPLRERREDIPMLAQHFLQQFGGDAAQPIRGFAQETLVLLERYDWPGNVRELEHVIERAVSLAHGPLVMPSDLPEAIRGAAGETDLQAMGVLDRGGELVTLDELEKRYVLRVLRETGGNKMRAARILGIDRRTLYRMAERFGLELGEDSDVT
jgi:transcriptional regulator with PAS, ATPase and Fis domain